MTIYFGQGLYCFGERPDYINTLYSFRKRFKLSILSEMRLPRQGQA